MRSRAIAAWLVALGAALVAPRGIAAHSEDTVVAWDCWIASGPPVSIRCIVDRDTLPPATDPFGDDDLEATLLGALHTALHGTGAEEAERLLHEGRAVLRHGALWTIVIYNMPYEASWREGRPERLVRATLCRRDVRCEVFLKPPASTSGVPGRVLPRP